MFSISRSRYSLFVQFLFVALNAAAVFLVTIYNASTPDMYPNNAHHKLGWVLTCIVSVQAAVGVISAYAGRQDAKRGAAAAAFMPVSAAAMAQHQRMLSPRIENMYRFSNDSGQGTEPNTESLRSQSISSRDGDEDELELPEMRRAPEEDSDDVEKRGWMHGSRLDKYLSRKIPGFLSRKVLRSLELFYDVVDRLILILGFAALATGIITYGGLFVSHYPTLNS